jgi:serine/threonine protein kinase/Tfp pilus assembly protein PilF
MGNATQLEDIVRRAQSLGPRERADFVRQACGDDAPLLSQVLSMLGTRAQQPEYWDEIPDAVLPTSGLEGQRLGPYQIVRKLGSGGMGDVYLAERADQQYQQQVAIKLVRTGMFAGQVHSRLRMERQILARLQHPNIARLLDGGQTADGTPYIVMEYIEGEAIDAWCDRRRLGLAQRVALVRTVCGAVHYAHQNLIVHRDLKPNNILITTDGTPKLLDFGIAKLLDNRQSLHTMAVTHLDYRVMTPAHASPEQVRGDVITTASDIYVLGVLLYELLCGRRPFQLEGSRVTDMERIICEQDAVAPSVMVSRTLHDAPALLADIANCRSLTGLRLRRELQGDLDNIVMMAMRKDASRRYASAEQLAADLERQLNGQAVMAASDSWLYRCGKFIRRHAIAVGAGALTALALTAFSAVTYVQAQRIARERDIAATERERAEQVSSFLVELFELSDPSHSRGNQITARELLDLGARRISNGLSNQPITRATLMSTIGGVYGSLGLYGDALPLQRDALAALRQLRGPHDAKVIKAMTALGVTQREQGHFDEAHRTLTQAMQLQSAAPSASALDLAPIIVELGRLAEYRDQATVARALYERSVGLYRQYGMERRPEMSSALNDLATLLLQQGEYAEAARLYRTALDIDRSALGRDHPQVAMHINNLAVTLQRQGRLEEAEPFYAQSLELMQRVLGPQHPTTLDALANYGTFLLRMGQRDRAEATFRDILQRDIAARGAAHAYVGHDHVNLGNALLDAARPSEASEEFTAALAIYSKALPAEHGYVAAALSGLGRAQLQLGDTAKAERTLRRATAMGEKQLQADSGTLAQAHSSLGRVLLQQKHYAEARALLKKAYPVLIKTQGADAPSTIEARTALKALNEPV